VGKQVTYREDAEWKTEFAAVKAELREVNPQAVQLITHLAWRGPSGLVGWHKGTAKTVLETSKAMGVEVGMPLPEAMATVMAALPKAKVAKLAKATKAAGELI